MSLTDCNLRRSEDRSKNVFGRGVTDAGSASVRFLLACGVAEEAALFEEANCGPSRLEDLPRLSEAEEELDVMEWRRLPDLSVSDGLLFGLLAD